jgi:4-amino-4-deoxy-L-arabinose transferase-like glycosyltransferase
MLALAVCLVVPPLVLVGSAGHALHEGDESIYAEMAREMVDSGRLGDLQWQGEVLFQRPPAAVWILAAARRLFGPGERGVRWPLAVAAGLEVGLLMLLGAALFRPSVGLLAGGWLATADLFIGYARYFETEPFLCCFILAALLCWEAARRRPWLILGWGAALGAALMTKQLVGALPLLAPLVDRLSTEKPRIGGRALALGLGIAAAVALPWHVWALARWGGPFVDSFLVGNVVRRASVAMHHNTRASFYLGELWRSEGLLGLLTVGGVGWAGVAALRQRRRADLLIALWAIGPVAAFSLARSRYDYYLLVAYPALALAAASLVLVRLPIRRPLAAALAVGWVAAAGLAHLPRNLAAFGGEDEVRALLAIAVERQSPPTPLYLYNRHPYAARYYGPFVVTMLLESEADARAAVELRRAGLPAPARVARDLRATVGELARPFLLLMPRARVSMLAGAPLVPIADSPHYVLFAGE